MKRTVFAVALLLAGSAYAQQFISTGMIEYEMRVNNHRMFGDGIFAEMFKDKLPNFSTYYYHLTFNDSKALYKFDRLNEKDKIPWNNNSLEENIWYSDYSSQTFTNQKFIFDNTYLLTDSLIKINWKLIPNETREIAGFNCRKAQGIIFDSVYVFAFYTDEIIVSGGPMGIHGLPGMILGVTIPRMFSSWIATKLEINGVNTGIISMPTKGKKKVASELISTVEKATKDWGQYGQQVIWQLFL